MALVAMLVPVFVIPFGYFSWYDMDQPEAIASKNTLLIWLCAAILVTAAVALWGPGWRRYRGMAGLAAAALAAYVLWGLLSTLASPARVLGWRAWLPGGMAAAAALAAPLFLRTPRRVAGVLLGALMGSAGVAGIGLVTVAGYRGFTRYFYGLDPRDVFDNPALAAQVSAIQGGQRSAASLSTLGNPEYVGTYCAALAAVALVILLDWTPRLAGARKWAARGGLLALVGGLLLLLAATTSRQAWIALGLAGLLRLALYIGVPALASAAGFCGVVLAALMLGVVPAAALGGLLVLAMLLWGLFRRDLFARIRAGDRFNLALATGLPALALAMLVAFSTPGPWNPSGLRILQRFASLVTRQDDSFRERALMFMLASEMARQNPLLGVGPGRYANQFSPTFATLVEEDASGVLAYSRKQLGRGIGVQTHNDYLQIAAETGLPALVFFLTTMLLLMGALAKVARRPDDLRAPLALATLIGIAAFLSIMMSSFPLHMPSRTAVFWMLVASAMGLAAGNDESPRDSQLSADEPAPQEPLGK